MRYILIILMLWGWTNAGVLEVIHMDGWKHPTRNVIEVESWQIDIYKRNLIDLTDFLTLQSITNSECGQPLGLCDKWGSVWPFQINWIHRTAFIESKRLLRERDYQTLFEFQMLRTKNRLDRKRPVYCYATTTIRDSVRCQAKLHNGNNDIYESCGKKLKECFADQVWRTREVLKIFYLNSY